jgi:hypothetical protein
MLVVGPFIIFHRREKKSMTAGQSKGPKTPMLPENHIYYSIDDKSNKCYDKCQNGLKGDKTGLLTVLLSWN